MAQLQIGFTKDEIILLNELCMQEIFNLGKLQYQNFIDTKAVIKRLAEVKDLMKKLPDLE